MSNWEIQDVVFMLMRRKRMSQKELCGATGLNKDVVSQFKKGRPYLSTTLERIATGLGYTVPELYAYLQSPGGLVPRGEHGPFPAISKADARKGKPKSGSE